MIDTPKSDDVVYPCVGEIESIVAEIPHGVSAVIPVARNGKQALTPENRVVIRREVSRSRVVQSEDAFTNYFSLDRNNGSANLSGEPYSLDWDPDRMGADARLMVKYFCNYENLSRARGVPRLQRDYFMLWSWLYFSPFMCEARNQAIASGDVFRYPSVAIVYGKSNCGKLAWSIPL